MFCIQVRISHRLNLVSQALIFFEKPLYCCPVCIPRTCSTRNRPRQIKKNHFEQQNRKACRHAHLCSRLAFSLSSNRTAQRRCCSRALASCSSALQHSTTQRHTLPSLTLTHAGARWRGRLVFLLGLLGALLAGHGGCLLLSADKV